MTANELQLKLRLTATLLILDDFLSWLAAVNLSDDCWDGGDMVVRGEFFDALMELQNRANETCQEAVREGVHEDHPEYEDMSVEQIEKEVLGVIGRLAECYNSERPHLHRLDTGADRQQG
jgi:hypothetical protein